jgi:uncharacterized protein with HEPN domain
MSPKRPSRLTDYLGHIVEAIDNISEYTRGMDCAAYMADKKTCDAVVRNFEVIGEACSNIAKHHSRFAQAHPEIPWRFAYEMRNALAHGYFNVDQNIVWQTIQADLPNLKVAVRGALGADPPGSKA